MTVVNGTYDDAVRASAALAGDRALVVSDTSWEGYTEVPRTVIDGYSTIFSELDAQLTAPPQVVVIPMGVGALLAAAVEHYAAHATIVAVEPRSAACGLHSAAAGHPVVVPGPHDSIMAGLNCGTVSRVAWPVVSRGVDVFVAVDDADGRSGDARSRDGRHRRRRDRRGGPRRSPRDRSRDARRGPRSARARALHRGRHRPERIPADRRPGRAPELGRRRFRARFWHLPTSR